MTHFSANEIFGNTAFIMFELGAVCPEKFVRTIGSRLLNWDERKGRPAHGRA
jgi:hypothetical protein